MNLFDDDPSNYIASCAEVRNDLGTYLAEDFMPDPAKRYRWYFSGGNETTPICIEYDVLKETRCTEIIGYKEPILHKKGTPKRIFKNTIKKFAHRCPVAALYSLMRRQSKIVQHRKNEMNRAIARRDAVEVALAKCKKSISFSGLRSDIPEYKKAVDDGRPS